MEQATWDGFAMYCPIVSLIEPFNSRVTGGCGHTFNVALIRMLLIKFMKPFVKLLSGEYHKTHLTQ